MSTQPTQDHITTATFEADPEVPVVRITRDFHASAEQLHRAHTDPELYKRWVGPAELDTIIDHWDASGMEVGINEGYAALDAMLDAGEIA